MARGKRNLRGSGLMSSSLLPGDEGAGDPMESMGNLMDVMLVFTCGLLLALVANWNIDLAGGMSSDARAVTEVDSDLTEVAEGIEASDENYSEVGTVYRDEDTGQLYLVTD